MDASPSAVLDSSVVVGGIGWAGGESRQVLLRLAMRSFASRLTAELAAERAESLADTAATGPRWRNPNWSAWLEWSGRASLRVEPSPLSRTVKHDPADVVVLAASVGERAGYLVTLDKHLLALGKPRGVQILTPRAFLSALA